MNLLLLSNSTNHANTYLGHAMETVLAHLDGRPLLFVPFALADHETYTATVRSALEPHGIEVTGLHEYAQDDEAREALGQAQAIFVGGGNTFRLLNTLHRRGLLDSIRTRVQQGVPYMGASAGTNLAGPTIRTTNDMPIVEPPSFTALGLVPFQINPHYLDADPTSIHQGETRQTRLREFLEENDVPILALREGTWLQVSENQAWIGGRAVNPASPGPARLFTRAEIREVDGDVSFLWDLGHRAWWDCGIQ